MGFLPQFKNDLFISYRRVSNESPDRWVDTFCANVRAELRDRVGDVAIWRDTGELQAGDEWRPKIAEAVESTGIFMALISRTYFDSDECRKELDRFLGRLKSADGAGGRKLMPIFKHPARSQDEMPAELREIGHHEFFIQEAKSWRELDPKRDADDYWERMGRMVQDLTAALEDMHGAQKKQALGTVFIARVGPELLQERERLRSDLRLSGFLVVPENEYLWNAADHRQRIANDLAGALLCIHLVGRNESIEPLTPARDKLQLQLAHAEMAQRGRPAPLIWVQPAAATAASQQPLISYIEQTLADEGVECMQGSLEELKDQMMAMLPKPAPKAVAKPREVALLVEERDLADLGPLKTLLADKLGAEPRPLKFTGTEPKDMDRLQRTLGACQQVVIFWSRQSEDWVFDLLDLPALAARLDGRQICVYASGEQSDEKTSFTTKKARVLQAVVTQNEAGLRDFFNALPGAAA